MTKQTASPSDIAHGAVVTEIATAGAAAEMAAVPEWIKILPAGKVTTRDGRFFIFDAEALAARFNADGIDIPVDLDHGISKNDKPAAVGWIKEMAAKPDGLYGRVDWLDAGKKVLAEKSRRFISPTFPHTKEGKAVWLHSVALVAAPALAMPALAHASPETATEENQMPIKSIAEALGLGTDADEAACLTAITGLSTGKVDKSVHDEALTKLSAATQELATLKADGRKKDVDDLLEGALADKKIFPAQRDHYEKLCATDEGFDQVKALLGATAKGLAPSGLDDKTTLSDDEPGDPVTLSAKATAYQAEQAAKGIHIDIAQAVNHVKGNG
ncbi:Mu-like prophage I protein [Labrenzia sp. THAF191b]|uniref:phage protease n=1 Tax=unclassified Labrenzia TaxID=2648686 RepID=UPI0012693A5D|nr:MULTISPECIES: phage protease [unclassified Labrenzia]QFS97568.1 Mu-like prophage I protein [Labrenzia sp. THAF191b]QFT03883.1 Mu-like prophage I protein [Labrenzia sp. THAF191a]QFT15425.1 Mu-like prophage I protein [Labrenzia sp. THAF187b]